MMRKLNALLNTNNPEVRSDPDGLREPRRIAAPPRSRQFLSLTKGKDTG